jgi:hypothetical protein
LLDAKTLINYLLAYNELNYNLSTFLRLYLYQHAHAFNSKTKFLDKTRNALEEQKAYHVVNVISFHLGWLEVSRRYVLLNDLFIRCYYLATRGIVEAVRGTA